MAEAFAAVAAGAAREAPAGALPRPRHSFDEDCSLPTKALPAKGTGGENRSGSLARPGIGPNGHTRSERRCTSQAPDRLPQRARRVAGGLDPALTCPSLSRLLSLISSNSTDFQHRGAVLRVKQYLRADAGTRELDAVIEALRSNTRIQAVYLQNFERGMRDEQLKRLTEVLKANRNIWALNVGENLEISLAAWKEFTDALEETCVSFLYVSEHHLIRSSPPLKPRMRAAIRANRDRLLLEGRVPTAGLARLIQNMWWNPTSWLEKLGVGTRTPREMRAAGENGGGGDGENVEQTRRSRNKKQNSKKPPPTLTRKADRGDYSPSKRPTSRSEATLRLAEERRARWEELRKAAQERVARKSAAQAGRLRRKAEIAAAVRISVHRAVGKALEAAGEGPSPRVASAASAAFAPFTSSSPSSSSSSLAAKKAAKKSSLEEKNKKKEEKLRLELRRMREKEAARQEKREPRRQKRGRREAREKGQDGGDRGGRRGRESRQRRSSSSPPPPPFRASSPWLRESRTLPPPSSPRTRRKPSLLLPRLGKAIPSGPAVPRRPRWLLFEGRSRRRRSAEGILVILEALLGGEEEEGRREREEAALPRAKEKKEEKNNKERKSEREPSALALKRREAKAARAALASTAAEVPEAAAVAVAPTTAAAEEAEEAPPPPLPPFPLPEEALPTVAPAVASPPLPAPPPLHQRLAAALLPDAAAAPPQPLPQPLPLPTTAAAEEVELSPPLPAAAEQQHLQHPQQLPFHLDDPLLTSQPESEWQVYKK